MTPSPIQTAQDLHRAAALVREHGHAIGEYIDPEGKVCAVGAIGLATGSYQRIQLPSGRWDFAHERAMARDFDDRTIAASEALAPLLPVPCADGRCAPPPPTGSLTTADEFHSRIADHAQDIVFHYNDFICEGGEELALLLEQAAEKIEADLP